MNAFRIIMLFMTSLAHAWGIYPGYFGYNAYSAVPGPYFPNIVPQTQPLFAYSFITPYGPYGPDVVAPITPAVASKSIYTAPDDTFSGYSIQTEYEGGAKSQVVFVTGPQANQILQKSVDLFRQFVPPEVGQLTGHSLNGVNATNTTDTPATTPMTLTPTASMYQVQLYPADTSSFLRPITPLQNLVSSFAYSITNDIANTIKDAAKDRGENAGEAQESMIHKTGAAVTAAPPNTTTQASENEVSTTGAESTTAAARSTTSAPPTTTPESTTISPTPSEDNEVAESNTTTASDEIMETTSS